jgi:hypothetical protein
MSDPNDATNRRQLFVRNLSYNSTSEVWNCDLLLIAIDNDVLLKLIGLDEAF